MKTRRTAFVLAFVFVGLTAVLVTMAVEGQEKQKVSGVELQGWFRTGHVVAGINEGNGCAFIVVNQSLDVRRQYYDCPLGGFGAATAKGTARIDGDRLCSTWDYSVGEICAEVYRIGENRYETRGGPAGQDLVWYYKLR